MKTTATNRKIRMLITALNGKTLIPKPEFQRRLVWSNHHKLEFLDTVLKGYPFPEIYIAAGTVNPETAEGTEMLVDGQQRITTLHQYFSGSPDLVLGGSIPAYAALDDTRKTDFLEYEVVVRDLGAMALDEIKEIFKRINSTQYALNAMEIHNARYDGEFKMFGETLSNEPFFEDHRVFTASDMRRMQDVRFCLAVAATCLSTYFDGDSELETYLERYNDEFDERAELLKGIHGAMATIDACQFPADSRVWKKPDLFTLVVELYRAQAITNKEVDAKKLGRKLQPFYRKIDELSKKEEAAQMVGAQVLDYYKASSQGTNHRGNRTLRGTIVQGFIEAALK